MLKAKTKYSPCLPNPKDFGLLEPELQVVEAGFTPNNLIELALLLKGRMGGVCDKAGVDRERVDRALNLECELSYPEFLALYLKASKVIPGGVDAVRGCMPEFGYSPYNLAVMEKDLALGQERFSKMLGWSASKLRQHIPANTNSTQYKAMKFTDWLYVCKTYEKAVARSDKENKVKLDRTEGLFVDRNRVLRRPEVPKKTILERLQDQAN